MHELNVLRTQWLILSMGIGAGFVLLFFISYLDYLRPRNPRDYVDPEQDKGVTWRQMRHSIPWVLILTLIGIFVLSIGAAVHYSMHPPDF